MSELRRWPSVVELYKHMKRIHALLEKQLFGICAGIADYMGVKTLQVRLSFIYLSFLTFGSPVLAYLVLLFWKRNTRIWKPWLWRGRKLEL
jgi:phage shock protein PspC (stress-responsive transcriptional regulator)